jgi:Glycosyltransferase family 87
VKTDRVTPAPPYYVKGLALGIPALLLGLQISGWLFFLPGALHGDADFRHLYTAGYLVRSGYARQLYDYDTQKSFQDVLVSREEIAMPFNHLAYEALLFIPLSRLRYRSAYFAFLAVNLFFLAISFRLLRPRMDNLARVWRCLPLSIFLGFLPIAAALMHGQDSVLLLTLLVAATVSLDRGRELAAGLLVGLGLFKFQLVIPIALLFLAWRRWRFSEGFALSGAAAGAVSLWLVGWTQVGVYARSLISMNVSGTHRFRYGIYPSRMPNLRGLISGLAATSLSAFWIQAATFALSGLVLLWVATRAAGKQRGAGALPLAITASTVVSYHLYIHDMSVLLVPVAMTLDEFIGAEATGDREGRLTARASALMFAAPACMSFIPFHFYLVSLPLLAFLLAIAAASRRSHDLPD